MGPPRWEGRRTRQWRPCFTSGGAGLLSWETGHLFPSAGGSLVAGGDGARLDVILTGQGRNGTGRTLGDGQGKYMGFPSIYSGGLEGVYCWRPTRAVVALYRVVTVSGATTPAMT